MVSKTIGTRFKALPQATTWLFFIWSALGTVRRPLSYAVLLTLTACGGGGITELTPVALSVSTGMATSGQRPLPPDFLTRQAVSYGPYITATTTANRADEIITDARVLTDLQLLIKAGFGLIRLFDSDDKTAGTILRVIKVNNLDLKVMLGIWIQNGNVQSIRDQTARGVALANSYPEIVQAVSIGNEAMVNWSQNMDPKLMAGYVREVRNQIKQPVTSDDDWSFYQNAPKDILGELDFVSIHSYPQWNTITSPWFWDWKQKEELEADRAQAMMNAALSRLKFDYNVVRKYLDSNNLSLIPIVIGETGWHAKNGARDDGEFKRTFSPINQKMYYDGLRDWLAKRNKDSAPHQIFYFAAFDEQWKGKDDGWGLFNRDRKARCVLRDKFSSGSWESGDCTPANAVKFIPEPVKAIVASAQYTLFANGTTAGEELPPAFGTPGGLTWNAWEGTSSATYPFVQDPASGDGGDVYLLTPNPTLWGWGHFLGNPNAITLNLSNYQASGHLRFSVKTTYPGTVLVGLRALSNEDGDSSDALVSLSDTKYGYCNTDTWCEVSIPMADLAAAGKTDLQRVIDRFVIADIFKKTGKEDSFKLTTPIALDNIRFTVN